jgi:hypothetical protein
MPIKSEIISNVIPEVIAQYARCSLNNRKIIVRITIQYFQHTHVNNFHKP